MMEPCCIISEEEVAPAIKGLKIGKASGVFGTKWMTKSADTDMHHKRTTLSPLVLRTLMTTEDN